MNTSDFEFDLPSHLIAKYPTAERSASRLMHLDASSGEISHYHFRDIVDLVNAEDLMVFNDTRVIPARFFAKKLTGGKVEILLERLLDDVSALVQIRSSKPLKAGAVLKLDDSDYQLTVNGRNDSFYRVIFPQPGVLSIANQLGHMPLPPYIDRADEISDQERYQTVFAEKEGAVAAPTAGLHFDDAVIEQLKNKGVASTKLTLHVGAGTFSPVRVTRLEDHVMHTEQIEVKKAVCDAVADCNRRDGRTIAVGTTSVRSLETASRSGQLKPYQGDTNIFIYPGYEFQSVDAVITNFHLSGSTLMMLVSAFAGIDNIKHAYQVAIEQQYRFFSYGDAMLITR
ncbi:MAG TPA: tRNA preQ1(34) S-adenosylmethionine ribosyltransferase-isomerase QueA [Gammaproteobacteria bacterium]|nr:tRNA preQ1(34) S-adenosylmethionine ribosyltransferase-isomerase QueA [Gammaproteobacteria bacterium]